MEQELVIKTFFQANSHKKLQMTQGIQAKKERKTDKIRTQLLSKVEFRVVINQQVPIRVKSL
jgi:hypothetical protein